MLLAGNSNDIVIERLRLASTGAAITNATLTALIQDPNKTTIATVSLSHEGDGDYRGSTTAQLSAGIEYKITVTASNYTFKRVLIETAIEPEV